MGYRSNLWLTVLFVAATVLYGIPTASAADDGFESIFNGKDLTGWDGDPRFWSVKDGAIRGQTTADNPTQGNTFLVWQDSKLKNFVLKIKFRLENHNSGVQYRSKEFGKWVIGGYQADIMETLGTVGFLYEERGRGWLVDVGNIMVIDADGKKNVVGKIGDRQAYIDAGYYKPREWNEYTITCRGNHITQALNGYETVELIDNDPKGRCMEGLLAMQLHAGPPMLVEFKDISIKRLPDCYGDAIMLFNGKDLDGWTFSGDNQKEVWSVKDGLLVDKGRPTGYIRTTADFTNYVLRLQFRHAAPGNGGVLLRMVGQDKVWPRSIEAQGASGNVADIWNIDQFPMTVAQDRTEGRRTRKMNPSNEKPGEWNRYEITLDGGNLELKVNGLVQNTATDCWETPGKICLQAEGSPMEFRNIVLIPIIKEAK